jgi:dihydrofolate reductase
MKVSAIAAMAENWVIGRNNALPWKLQDDLIRFRRTTLNHPIIMGRKTFESIGRILPGREHWIISRNTDYKVPGAQVVSSIQEAIKLCEGKTDEVFIIGGSEIYRQSLTRVDRLYLTIIHQKIEGDAHFPEIHFEFSQDGKKIQLSSDRLNQNAAETIPIFETIVQEDHLDAPLPYRFLILDRKS